MIFFLIYLLLLLFNAKNRGSSSPYAKKEEKYKNKDIYKEIDVLAM